MPTFIASEKSSIHTFTLILIKSSKRTSTTHLIGIKNVRFAMAMAINGGKKKKRREKALAWNQTLLFDSSSCSIVVKHMMNIFFDSLIRDASCVSTFVIGY